jgi:endonuclease YncB( thermonuclease family)
MSVLVFMVKGFLATGFFLFLNCLPAYGWEGYVTKVLDGDSLRVKKGSRVHEIRLYGIDSPEYGQLFWLEAKGLTRELVLGKIVNVKPMDTDQYGRIVALVWHQGQLVNSELVRAGLAWVYPRYCQTQSLCNDMKTKEDAAHKQGVGLWREKSPMAPWLWKRL